MLDSTLSASIYDLQTVFLLNIKTITFIMACLPMQKMNKIR
jgi:hypothetical protein